MESNPQKNIHNEQYKLDDMILQNMNELNKVNQYLHEYSIELWRIEEKCRIKTNSIKEIENSITLVNTENKWLEEKLHDTESNVAQVRDNIISMDNIMVTLFDTLTDLEIKCQKKEFSKNKSRKNFELQILMNMEMWQNEEERLNNIPEIKALRIAESELENMKLEYEELLIDEKNLVDNISKANEENNKKMNDIIINFANLYVEMESINKEKEISRALLSKLDSEYNEKLNIKNSLLVSKKKKLNNTPLWTFDFYTHDSKIIDLKLDSLKKNLKLNFKYSNFNNPKLSYKEKLDIEPSKFKNKPKKNVTFLLPSEDKISDKNDIITLNTYKNVNTNLVDTNISKDNMCTNSTFIKDIPKLNVDTDKLLKTVFIDPIKKNVDHKKIKDISDIDFQTNKRKKTKTNVQFDFQFKKPNNPVQVEIDENKTQTNSNTVNSSINKKNNDKNKLIDIQEEIVPMNTLIKNNKHIKKNSSEFIENSHLTKPTSNSGNINMFDNILQYDERSSHDQNNILSGLFWNDSTDNMDNMFESSENFSYCDSDDIGDTDQDIQWSFMNSLNNGQSNLNFESNYRGLKIINSKPSESFKFQPFNNEPIKEMTSADSNIFMKASTSRTFSDFTQPIQLRSKPPAEQFRFNFN